MTADERWRVYVVPYFALGRVVVHRRTTALIKGAVRDAASKVPHWHHEAAPLVARLLHRHLAALHELLSRLHLSARRAPLAAPDEAVARYLESIGPAGSTIAAQIRTRSTSAFSANDGSAARARDVVWLWRQKVPRVVRCLALALAIDVAIPACAKTSQVSLVVVSRARDAYWRPAARGHPQADPTATSADDEFLRRALAAVRTLPGHRLFRWLLTVGQRQERIGHPDPRCVTVRGGFDELADEVGVRGHRGEQQVMEALGCMQQLQLKLPGGFISGLISYSVQRSRPRTLRIVLGDPLFPSWVSTLPKGSGSPQQARMLLPVPITLPPLVGRYREHAALATLQIEVLMELRRRAEELLAGGVFIDDWSPLLRRAGVPASTWQLALPAWTAAGPEQFLTIDGQGRVSLAEPYARERASIIEAAVLQQQGRRRRARRK